MHILLLIVQFINTGKFVILSYCFRFYPIVCNFNPIVSDWFTISLPVSNFVFLIFSACFPVFSLFLFRISFLGFRIFLIVLFRISCLGFRIFNCYCGGSCALGEHADHLKTHSVLGEHDDYL